MTSRRDAEARRDSAFLIACALGAEADQLRRLLAPGDWRVEVTGVGVRRTRRRLTELLADRPPGLLIFTGSAGGLKPSLEVGAVVFPERWRLSEGPAAPCDPATLAKLRGLGWEIAGTGCTVESPVVDPAHRSQIGRDLQAIVCDMEAAAALETAARHRVPAIALKVLADSVRDPGPASDKVLFEARLKAVMPRLAASLTQLMADLARK